MAIKNFLFLQLALASLCLMSCQSVKMRSEHGRPSPAPSGPSATPRATEPPPVPPGVPQVLPPSDISNGQPVPNPVVTPPPPQHIPKVALIFGPGGARSFGVIGFLQELQKYRVPVQSVGGVEWGSVMAAFYSLKGSLNDVEWQLAKIKTDDVIKKSLVSGAKMNEASSLKGFFNDTISKYQVEQVRLPFACPAYNIAKNQTYIMNKGPFTQLLPYCVSYPPLFKAYNSNLSGIRDLKPLVDYFRGQGANYVILVNVLGTPGDRKNITGSLDSPENLYWNEIAGFYAKPVAGVDQVVNLNLDDFTLYDFDRKREIIQKGSQMAAPAVEALATRFGF